MYNVYPDGDNKPRFSFDVPTTPPDIDPDEGDTIGAYWNPAWTAPMLAALDQLILYATWTGTDDEKQLAVMRAVNLKELIAAAIPEQFPTPTPFWDTATDADDQYGPGELAPWYGTATVTYHSPPDVTFVEQLFIWTFAGFMAISGSPGAALAFLTIAPNFVIAFKTGDIGAIVDIIVDAAHIATVDTHSSTPGILEIPIVGDPANDTHQIYIVKDDDPDTTVQVVRSELSPQQVTPKNVRYNSGTDTIQMTPDDGTTWVDDPTHDPRTSTLYQLAAAPTDNPKCDAAERAIDTLRDEINGVIEAATATQAVNLVLDVILIFVPGFGIIAEVIWIAVEALLFIGQTALDTAFTDAVYTNLKCLWQLHVGSDGIMTPEGLTAWQTDVETAYPTDGVIAASLSILVDNFGLVQLNNAAVKRTEIGNCSACYPQWEFFPDGAFDGGYRGECVGGEWTSTNRPGTSPYSSEIMMRVTLAPSTLTRVSVTYSKSIGGADAANADAIIVNSANGWYNGTQIDTQNPGTSHTASPWVWTGSQALTGTLTLWLFAASTNAPPGFGSATVTHIEVDTSEGDYVWTACGG